MSTIQSGLVLKWLGYSYSLSHLKTNVSKWLPFVHFPNSQTVQFSNNIWKPDHLTTKQVLTIWIPDMPSIRITTKFDHHCIFCLFTFWVPQRWVPSTWLCRTHIPKLQLITEQILKRACHRRSPSESFSPASDIRHTCTDEAPECICRDKFRLIRNDLTWNSFFIGTSFPTCFLTE